MTNGRLFAGYTLTFASAATCILGVLFAIIGISLVLSGSEFVGAATEMETKRSGFTLLVAGVIMLAIGIPSGIFVWRKRTTVRAPPLPIPQSPRSGGSINEILTGNDQQQVPGANQDPESASPIPISNHRQ